MTQKLYDFIETDGAPIKAWRTGVPFDELAETQARNVARLPFIHRHVATMADAHGGMGVPIGAVIPCEGVGAFRPPWVSISAAA